MSATQEYIKAVSIGEGLIAQSSDPNTPQSQWTAYSSLEEQGWTLDPDELDHHVIPLAKLIQDPSLSQESGEHYLTATNFYLDSSEKHARPAFYKHTYHVPSGTIFALSLHSPHAVLRDGGIDQTYLPRLRHWSDVAFLMWQKHSPVETVGGLKRVVHCQINNKETVRLVSGILARRVSDQLAWAYPGHTFNNDGSDDFAALLGSPNGRGTGHMVAEHKEQMGGKGVKCIQVFTVGASLYMILNLA